MLLFLPALALWSFSLVSAQDPNGEVDVHGSDSKVAITGIIIGAILIVLSLVAVAVYGIDRWMSRRRSKKGSSGAKFMPLNTVEEVKDTVGSKSYRYLATPAPIRLPAGRDVPSPLAPSPSASATSFGSTGGSAAQSMHFDPYGRGPYYPESPQSRVNVSQSPGTQSTYGHGPFYPESPSRPTQSPKTPSFQRSASTSTSASSPPPRPNIQALRQATMLSAASVSSSSLRSAAPSS
ncbi:hypothetical protein FB45DRAFT_936437 [Roridomyces roridus]|uniref:Uncharacterized protein n=1 Tax=Roridomyces roridus TaxID=1738132 RepID=A0AAD7BA30_9AGAR|nr:hypothetical protein FB45DRAFT_936437 [Roridomyces roridus]